MSVKHRLCAIGALTLFGACPARALPTTPSADCLDEFWAGKPPVLAADGMADTSRHGTATCPFLDSRQRSHWRRECYP